MVTVGTDPELFMRDSSTGLLVPSCGLIGGTKTAPVDLGDGFGLQEDNVMLEFNVPPSSDTFAMAECVREGLARALSFVRTKLPTAEFDTASEQHFSNDLLAERGARTFGCSVDYDAYQQGRVAEPVDPEALNEGAGAWRFAGGHVHLGYDNPDNIPPFVVAAFADLFLGLPAVALDKQPKRRKLYGAPGRYRPTPYGIEYRTLSNFWVMDFDLACSVSSRAVRLGQFIEREQTSRLQKLYRELPWRDVANAIETEDEDAAANVLAYAANDLGLREVTR